MLGLLDLPTDILLVILGFAFVVEDILSLRKTCHRLYEVSKSRSVWQAALHLHVLNQDMPIPRLSGPVETLTDKELELCVLRAVRLRRNWSSPTPSHHPVTRIYPLISQGQSARSIATHFISGPGGRRWLLTLSNTRQHWLIDCWDIGFSPPRPIGRRQYSRTISGIAFNSNEESENAVAICHTNGSIELLSLDFRATDPALVFLVTTQFSTKVLTWGCRLPVFSGQSLLIQCPSGHLGIINVNQPDHEAQLASFSGSDEATCLAAIINLNVAVIFRRKSVEIYDISMLSPPEPGQQRKLDPLDMHTWQWGADKLNAVALPQWPATHTSTAQPYFPITILLRHGSIYPWPVNILHQYTLGLAPHFDPSLPLSSKNIPYNITPVPIRAISSPVRLTALSSSALGSYGTAVWFDSNTEDYVGPGMGQRVAGIFTSLPPVESDNDEEGNEGGDQGEVTAASVAQMEPSSVYASRQQDSWVNIAVDEIEGRIALGCEDGGVDLFEYE